MCTGIGIVEYNDITLHLHGRGNDSTTSSAEKYVFSKYYKQILQGAFASLPAHD
jgi:hypothetical protein